MGDLWEEVAAIRTRQRRLEKQDAEEREKAERSAEYARTDAALRARRTTERRTQGPERKCQRPGCGFTFADSVPDTVRYCFWCKP